MKFSPLFAAAALGLGTIALPAAALPAAASTEHVAVVSTTPAAGSKVSGPRTVTLTFNQALPPSEVGVAIVMTAMPGMANHGEMAIRNFTQGWSADGRTLTLSLRQPLRAGTYDVRWQAAAHGHRMNGKVTFDVK